MRTKKAQICLCRLISTFAVHCWDSTISQVSILAVSWLCLASVAEQAGFESYLVENPEDKFSRDKAHIDRCWSGHEVLLNSKLFIFTSLRITSCSLKQKSTIVLLYKKDNFNRMDCKTVKENTFQSFSLTQYRISLDVTSQTMSHQEMSSWHAPTYDFDVETFGGKWHKKLT